MNATTNQVRIDKVYPDASGAPATVTVRGWEWAADMLGEVRVRPILPRNYSGRGAPKWMAAHVAKVYHAALAAHVDGAWLAANRAMYASVSP